MSRRATLSGRGFVLPREMPTFGFPMDFLGYWHSVALTEVIRDFVGADIDKQAELDGFSAERGMRHAINVVSMCAQSRQTVAAWIGIPADRIWPKGWDAGIYRSRLARPRPNELKSVLKSAQAFRLAIDALPVGRDIRARLNGHIDTHIASIEALGGRP